MIPIAFAILGDQTGRYDWFPVNASTFAEDIDWLFWFISAVCVLFFVPIAFCLFYFAYRFHKPKGEKAESKVTHNTPLELAWSILPSFFLIGMFVMGASSYLDQRTIPDGAHELGVQAYKWGWLVDYGGGTLNPELHVLLGEPTKLTMRSSDVIHSFFVPAFRVKRDIVPGRYNYVWFEPTLASEKVPEQELAEAQQWTKESGEAWNYDKWQFTPDGYRFFDLYCTEYCGTNHSEMQSVVVVHDSMEDLAVWLEKVSRRVADPDSPDYQPPEVYGKGLYETRGCAGCHSTDGNKLVGPSFLNLYGTSHQLASGETITVDENYVAESIKYPKEKIVATYPPVMPSYQGQLSEDDIYSLIEYLKSISENTPAEEQAEEGTIADDFPVEPVSESAVQE